MKLWVIYSLDCTKLEKDIYYWLHKEEISILDRKASMHVSFASWENPAKQHWQSVSKVGTCQKTTAGLSSPNTVAFLDSLSGASH